MAMYYNRALFEEAGLDPDNPPETWQDVHEAAQMITEKTDAQGMVFTNTENTGGWIFTPIVNGFGGRTVSEDGTTATFDDPAVKEALEFYHDLRWEDNAVGSNFLMSTADANQTFASGGAGMYVISSDAYQNLVSSLQMDSEDVGLAPLPQNDDGLGTLAGGAMALINPTATPEEIAATVKWLSYFKFRQYTDEDYAVSSAKAQVADGAPVGIPGLSLVSQDLVDQWLEWVSDEVNVPRENYTDFIASVTSGDPAELPLVPEPRFGAQQIYAIEDTLIQTVFTDENADIDALITDAQDQAQAAIDEAATE